MTREEFNESIETGSAPDNLSPVLKALWYDAKGDWDQAHTQVQDLPGKSGSRIHAYLHRKEGDISNARYWYGRADAEMPDTTLEAEWSMLVDEAIAGRL